MNRRSKSSSQSRYSHEALESRRLLAFGALDTSFDKDGIATVAGMAALDAVVQNDGKTIVVGNSGGSVAMARFNLDGTIDDSFGPAQNGTVLQKVGSLTNLGRAVALQDDGKILVAVELIGGSE